MVPLYSNNTNLKFKTNIHFRILFHSNSNWKRTKHHCLRKRFIFSLQKALHVNTAKFNIYNFRDTINGYILVMPTVKQNCSTISRAIKFKAIPERTTVHSIIIINKTNTGTFKYNLPLCMDIFSLFAQMKILLKCKEYYIYVYYLSDIYCYNVSFYRITEKQRNKSSEWHFHNVKYKTLDYVSLETFNKLCFILNIFILIWI